MGFTFSLQALLNWKRSLEENSQMRLAALVSRLRAEEEEIERLTLQRLSHERNLAEKSGRGMAAGEYLLYKQFSEESRKDLLSREEKRRKTLREVERERERLLGLTKEKKVLEKLREKQLKQFLARLEKAEQKKNDEMTLLRYPPPPKRESP